MGLHINYELSLPGTTDESVVSDRLATLRERALLLPFEQVSQMVHLTEQQLEGPSPTRGLVFTHLEDVAHNWAQISRRELYRRSLGIPDEDESARLRVKTPSMMRTEAHAFVVHPGRGSEPATFGLLELAGADDASLPWWWYGSCKTQYASVVSDEHLVRCHTSLVTLLDEAVALGFDVVVRDETGYWVSRDPATLVTAVAEMNRIVARFAGTFIDAMRDAGMDSRQAQGAIFEHPDFERLEGDGGA